MNIPPNLINRHFDDRYFDVVNALDEAQQIHFRHNNLLERVTVSAKEGVPFVIGETGFGPGRIVVALMEFLESSTLKNVTIEYNSVELYPLSPERMFGILNVFSERAGGYVLSLVEEYSKIDITEPGWHKMKIEQPFGEIFLNLWTGEALEMVQALENQCDVWFLDGHGPKKNPDIWRPELLMEIGKKTKVGGSCTTFTVAGSVKSALAAAGFSVSKLPGCGGKKEVLRGTK